MRQRLLFTSFLILFLLSLSLTGYLTQQYVAGNEQRAEESFRLAQESAIQVASRLNEELALAKSLGDRLARDVANGKLPPYQLARQVEADLESHPVLFGMGMAYERGKYLPRRELYAPFFCP